uniref:Histone acetyltransferase n=1 Tax=Panagrolaimus sp. JU765 TaxID=591449 RepID=A0AC34Q695_9BILA
MDDVRDIQDEISRIETEELHGAVPVSEKEKKSGDDDPMDDASSSKKPEPETIPIWVPKNSKHKILKASSAKGVDLKSVIRNTDKEYREKFVERYIAPKPTEPQTRYIYMNSVKMETPEGIPISHWKTLSQTVFICSQCLQDFDELDRLNTHIERCRPLSMPGKEIYRDESRNISVFECCGTHDQYFCESLCILGSCFINHKCLLQCIEPFYFYVLFERKNNRYSFAGYFSKQKYRHGPCNLCCLLVLPCCQGKGYGRFLVDFSFLLSRKENYAGGPEFPLSTAANKLYTQYIYDAVCNSIYNYYLKLKDGKETTKFNLESLEIETGIRDSLLMEVMVALNMMIVGNNGKNIEYKFDVIAVQDSVARTQYKLCAHDELLKWKPDPLYGINELLHFPEIEQEKVCHENGVEFYPVTSGQKTISKTSVSCCYSVHDSKEAFEAKNKPLDLSRSHIFTFKGDKKEGVTINNLKTLKRETMPSTEKEEFILLRPPNANSSGESDNDEEDSSARNSESEVIAEDHNMDVE